MSNETDVMEFIGVLDGGVLEKKIAHMLNDVALGTVLHGDKTRRGKLSLELTFQPLNGESSQVAILHKLSHSTPTKRGKKIEENTTETIMFVGRGGRLSIEPPREEIDGQFTLVHQLETKQKVR